MVFGTCHFENVHAAVQYFQPYGYDVPEVERKLREGEIRVGPPICAKDETCYLNPQEGRYFKRVSESKSHA